MASAAAEVGSAPSPNKQAILDGCLSEIHEKNGFVSKELLFQTISDPNHPLHDEIDWSDQEAAHKWRLEQCAQMIRTSKYVAYLNEKKDEPIPVRRYVSIPGRESKYMKRGQALSVFDFRADFINRKLSMLQSWCNETADIQELAVVRRAILRAVPKVDTPE
jgi:hypothetical protein